jgi:hypothetical protein
MMAAREGVCRRAFSSVLRPRPLAFRALLRTSCFVVTIRSGSRVAVLSAICMHHVC